MRGPDDEENKPGANPELCRGNPDRTASDPAWSPGNRQRLWTSIQSQYRIEDAGGLAVLQQACEAADRAERCRKIINADGELVEGKDGGLGREHPLLKAEIAAKAFLVRALSRLHLDMEPVRAQSGRPPGHGA